MLWFISLAAADIVLLSDDVKKSEMADLEQQCEDALSDEQDIDVRSSRYFMTGKGFKYRIVVEGIDSLEDAKEVRGYLDSVPMNFVIVVDGQEYSEEILGTTASVTKDDEPKTLVQQIKEVVPVATKDNKKKKKRMVPTSQDVLLHAIDAHKLVVSNWDQIQQEKFHYYRKRPEEGTLLYHRFYQSGEALRLDITIKKGDGMNSTTVLPDEGESWITSDEKKVSRNAIRTRELLERFSSSNTLSIAYSIAKDMETNGSWDQLTEVEEVDDTWLLTGAEATTIKRVSFYQQSWLLATMVVEDVDGAMEYMFRDYRMVEGVGLLPHVIQIFDDDVLIEEIQIESLDVTNRLDKSLFESN